MGKSLAGSRTGPKHHVEPQPGPQSNCIFVLRDHRKSSQKPTKRTFGGGGGGGWNENRTVGFTVCALLKLVVTLKPGLR